MLKIPVRVNKETCYWTFDRKPHENLHPSPHTPRSRDIQYTTGSHRSSHHRIDLLSSSVLGSHTDCQILPSSHVRTAPDGHPFSVSLSFVSHTHPSSPFLQVLSLAAACYLHIFDQASEKTSASSSLSQQLHLAGPGDLV